LGNMHTEYVFMTIKSQKLRVAVGNRAGKAPVIYAYSLESTPERSFYSYRLYMNALTEDEGKTLQQLVEEKQTRKANALVLSVLSRGKCIGPCDPIRLSDLVPDEWFDGCKRIIDMLSFPRITGVCPFDTEDDCF